MDKAVNDAVNKQIQAEMDSAYLYLAMAAYAEAKDLNGVASWMKIQAQEEMEHAMKFYGYVYQTGGEVELLALPKPKKDFGSILDIFEAALDHEKLITSKINSLYELSMKKKDYAFQSFLKWYIDEQVEEESTAADIIAQIKMIGDSKEGIFMLDKELGSRSAEEESAE
ncbi:ferritin [Candidatus Peregrinibacteria bacterium]|jgi:ferritin|nr:ferritin [Candidatus Peregrinibacteria bacterium]MBT7736858.1 ferritin [Candidatus Peregrinibacteria bacterium]